MSLFFFCLWPNRGVYQTSNARRLTLDSTESDMVIIRSFLLNIFEELELNNGEHTKKMCNIVIRDYL
jgi:hypothetical protein